MKQHGALIGFGNIAEKGHWPSYAASQDCDIVAVMDPSEKRRAAALALNPDLRMYASTEDLFRAEKVDFVDICTPPASHAALILQALQHNAHVLCEKPLVLSEDDYKTIGKEMVRRKRVIFAVHNWKYAPIIQEALRLIRADRIGKILHAELFVWRDNVCQGTAQGATGAAVPTENWRQDPAVAGGGILLDHGWHAFYLLMNLVGAEPQSILTQMSFGKETPDRLEEEVRAFVQFPEAAGSIHLTWRAPVRRNTIHIQGLKGTILLDDDRLIVNERGRPLEEHLHPALSAGSHHADWFQALLPDFLDEMRSPAKQGVNFREAGWCAALTKAAYDSHRQGSKLADVAFPNFL